MLENQRVQAKNAHVLKVYYDILKTEEGLKYFGGQ